MTVRERITKYDLNRRIIEIRRQQRELEKRYNHNHDPKTGRFTGGNGLTGKTKSAKININAMYRKSDDTANNYSYISIERIHQLTVEVRKNGAEVIIDEPWFNERLENNNASAVTYGNIIVFGKNVTVSDVLEECYHFMQNKSHLNDDKPEPIRTYLNEIDAKEYLLTAASKYKIPRNETELTKKQLKSYYELLEQTERGDNNA